MLEVLKTKHVLSTMFNFEYSLADLSFKRNLEEQLKNEKNPWWTIMLSLREGMLLIVVLINDPSSPMILLVKEVSLIFIDLNQSIVSVSGRLSPHHFEMFSISPLQAYSFRCWFSNNSVKTFSEGCFPSSLVAQVGIFFSILLFQWSIFYSFSRRHCDSQDPDSKSHRSSR